MVRITHSTFALIVSTCSVLYLTYVFYIPKKLAARLQKMYNKRMNQRIYFDGLSKVFNYSISKADEELARQTYSAFLKLIIDIRADKKGVEVEYPDEFYDNIFEANELLLKRERKTLSYLNDGSLLSIFIDQVQGSEISEKTYQYMWLGMRQAVLYNNSEAIKTYWESAHQYASYTFNRIHPEYDSKFKLVNQKELYHQKKVRDKFVEFHYALGGLLLHNKMYSTLEYIMSWTNQLPPKYLLVPSTMSEVVNMYMKITTRDHIKDIIYFESHFPFIGVNGVKASDIICHWIKKYIAVLFLRQYTLHSYYISESTLQMPDIPSSMSKKRRWNQELDVLKNNILDVLNDKELVETLDYNKLKNAQWFVDNGMENPENLIESYKTKINSDMEQTRKMQPISELKRKEFYEATKKILQPVFEQYQTFYNNALIPENCNKIFVRGLHIVLDKQAYADDQEMSYMNFDSIVAENASMEFSQIAQNIFVQMSSLKYLLKGNDIWHAIDLLILDLDRSELVIFSIGNNLNYLSNFQSKLKYEHGQWAYNGVLVVNIDNMLNELVAETFWIVKKIDVPYVVFNDITDNSVKEKYQLEEIDDSYHIYSSIIDINASSNIKSHIDKTKITNIDEKVLACVDFNAEIGCGKTAKAIQLKLYRQFESKEHANSISDIDLKWL